MDGLAAGERAGRRGPSGRPLDEVLADLGSAVVALGASGATLATPVTAVVVFDRAYPTPLQPGDVLLGVGVDPTDPSAVDLVAECGRAGVAALALKGAAPATLVRAAAAAGTCVLDVLPELDWGQLLQLLRTAAAGGPRDDAEDGVPLGDLFALANAVAARLGAPVSVEDPQSRVLAYSNLGFEVDEPRRLTILGRRVPASWVDRLTKDGVFRRIARGEVVLVPARPEDGLRARLCVGVLAGDVLLGSIWVAEADRPFNAADEEGLAAAADLAALHLIRHRQTADLERTRHGQLARRLLEGDPSGAAELGIGPEDVCAVVAFAASAADPAREALSRQRLVDLVALYGEAFRRKATCVAVGAVVYALFPAPGDRADRLASLANDIVDRALDSLQVDLVVGIGGAHAGAAGAAASRREADRVVRALTARSTGGRRAVASIDDVRTQIVLDELSDALRERPHLLAGPVQVLAEHDRRHKTAYIATLRAYFDHCDDIRSAAAATDTHHNTFRYRLKRLCEASGLDLEDADARLVAMLQIRLLPS